MQTEMSFLYLLRIILTEGGRWGYNEITDNNTGMKFSKGFTKGGHSFHEKGNKDNGYCFGLFDWPVCVDGGRLCNFCACKLLPHRG
jgi:hypothetical protein